MSYTSIFCFNKEGKIISEKQFENAWFSAPRVWDAIGKKYIKNFLNCLVNKSMLMNLMRDLSNVEEYEAIAYLSTCDNVIVKRKGFQRVVDAFRKFEVEDPQPSHTGSTIGKQADYIEYILKNNLETEYIGWNQTSLNSVNWYTPDEPEDFDKWDEKDQETFWSNPPHYNINTMYRHWFMFTED